MPWSFTRSPPRVTNWSPEVVRKASLDRASLLRSRIGGCRSLGPSEAERRQRIRVDDLLDQFERDTWEAGSFEDRIDTAQPVDRLGRSGEWEVRSEQQLAGNP